MFISQIVPLRINANETHSRYGINRYPEIARILPNAIAVASAATQSTQISANAQPG